MLWLVGEVRSPLQLYIESAVLFQLLLVLVSSYGVAVDSWLLALAAVHCDEGLQSLA